MAAVSAVIGFSDAVAKLCGMILCGGSSSKCACAQVFGLLTLKALEGIHAGSRCED